MSAVLAFMGFALLCFLLVLGYLITTLWQALRRMRRRRILLAPSERCERDIAKHWKVGMSSSGWRRT